MMNPQKERLEAAVSRGSFAALLPLLARRRVVLSILALAVLSGLALYWNTLAALGIAPVLIATLPCLAMCGLRLSMNRAGNKDGGCNGSTNAAEVLSDHTGSSR